MGLTFLALVEGNFCILKTLLVEVCLLHIKILNIIKKLNLDIKREINYKVF